MRIRTLCLDGYGRFSGAQLDLAPGFQIIAGPNEQGKTTLRAFIADMLYGQKRSNTQRLYDKSHEVRRPWHDPKTYRGRLVYELDSGTTIEAHRNFDRRNESVQLFDRTHGREITHEFPRLNNREVAFAEEQLGLSKSVFLSAATISHMSLESLGDKDALREIREKLLSLADSGENEGSAEAALRILDDRMAAIGRPTARTKPLPAARNRLQDLEAELREAHSLASELKETEEKRQREQLAIAELRSRREEIEAGIYEVEKADRAKRLAKADALAQEINAAQQQCFALSHAQSFPVERLTEVRQAANDVASAEGQLGRSEAELEQLDAELAEEQERLGAHAQQEASPIPDEWDDRLETLEDETQRLQERIQSAEEAVNAAQTQVEQAQEALKKLPDFSRMQADPMEWLQQLAHSFSVAVRSRDEEVAEWRNLKQQTESQREAVKPLEAVFGGHPEFAQEAREHEVESRVAAEQLEQLDSQIAEAEGAAEDYESMSARDYWIAGLSVIALIGLAYGWYLLGNPGMLLPIAFAGLLFLWTVVNMAYTRRTVQGLRHEAKELRAQRETVERQRADREDAMNTLLRKAGCDTLRELEAMHERYREGSAELRRLERALAEQERFAREEQAQVKRLFEHVQETLQQVGERVEDEGGVDKAAKRAVARYQEYRDAKRRLTDARQRLQQKERQLAELKKLGAAKAQEEREATLEARRLMRESGFREEQRYTTARQALKQYRIRAAEMRRQRSRLDVLTQQREKLEERIEEERERVAERRQALDALLAKLGVNSLEECEERADEARRYRELRERSKTLQNQLEHVLDGQDIESLRARVEQEGPAPEGLEGDPESLRQELNAVDAEIDERLDAEHALHIALTERVAGARSLNEIEEEKAAVEQQVALLEEEFEATSYAAALIEEVARDRHARIAPRLAQRAGEKLSAITGGRYNELFISRDLRLSVRIPQTAELDTDAESRLSKGTVDQIYFALRLAMMEALSEQNERAPMLLDDPFANYDDARLRHAIELLAQLGEHNQIILFTCRDDVLQAAKHVNAPTIHI